MSTLPSVRIEYEVSLAIGHYSSVRIDVHTQEKKYSANLYTQVVDISLADICYQISQSFKNKEVSLLFLRDRIEGVANLESGYICKFTLVPEN